MTQIRQRPAGEAGRGATADNVQAGQQDDTKPRAKPASTFFQLDEMYAIGADVHSWQVLKRCNRRDGRRWEPILWYVSLEQCINALAARAVRTCGARTLAEALAECNRVTAVICRALRPSLKVEVGK